MILTATAATPPPPSRTSNGLPPALPGTPGTTTVLPMTSKPPGLFSKLPMKAIIGGAVGAGLGFLLLGPIGALALGAVGALIGAKLGNRGPGQP